MLNPVMVTTKVASHRLCVMWLASALTAFRGLSEGFRLPSFTDDRDQSGVERVLGSPEIGLAALSW